MVRQMKEYKKRLICAAAGFLLLSGCSAAPRGGSGASLGSFPTADFDPDEGKYGYRDEAGAWVIDPSFDYAEDFSANGLARTETDGKWGFIDASGAYRVEPRFDYADSFAENGTASVAVGCETDGLGQLVGGKWGYIAEDGSYLIEPCFDWAYSFEDDRARVIFGGKYGYVDLAGEFTADQ